MYRVFTLPHGFKFDELTRKQARENFQAFVERIPERLQTLEEIIQQEIPKWRPDLSDESLPPLGEWYARHVEERPMTEQERSAFMEKMGAGWEFLADLHMELTRESYSYGIDMGIYVGECIRSRCPLAKWKLCSGAKRYTYFHMPVLAGFRLVGTTVPREFSPVSMAATGVSILQARKYQRFKRTQPSGAKPQTGTLDEFRAAFAAIEKDPCTMLGEIVAMFQEEYVG